MVLRWHHGVVPGQQLHSDPCGCDAMARVSITGSTHPFFSRNGVRDGDPGRLTFQDCT